MGLLLRKRESISESRILVYLLDDLEARNGIAFWEEVLFIQRLKSSFVFLLCSETKMFVVDGPLMLLSSFHCLGGL